MAPKIPQLRFDLKVWLYLKPEDNEFASCHLAAFFKHYILEAPWTAKPLFVSTKVQPKSEKVDEKSLDEKDEGEVFSCIQIVLRTTERIASPEMRLEVFSSILRRLSKAFARSSCFLLTGIDSETKRIISWSLQDPTSDPDAVKPGISEKDLLISEKDLLSAWVLPLPPKDAAERPAGKIEAELYKLATIDQKRPKKSYLKPVEATQVLVDLQIFLYAQHELYYKLKDKQKILENPDLEEGSIKQHIDEYVEMLEDMDDILCSVVAMYDHSIGRRNFSADFIGQRDRSRSADFRLRLLRFIGIHKYGTIKINDEHFEELKDRSRQHLLRLQRNAPLLAAHARLQESETSQKVNEACNLAREGPERTELTSKMGIQPANLNNKKARIAALSTVYNCYETVLEELLVELEALDRIVAEKVTWNQYNIFRSRPLAPENLKQWLYPPVFGRLRQAFPHYWKYDDLLGHEFYYCMGWDEQGKNRETYDEYFANLRKSLGGSSISSSDTLDKEK